MSVDFGPRPVRRSRGPDAGVLIVVGLVTFIGLAVLKPWGSVPSEAAPRPSVTASPTAGEASGQPTSSAPDGWDGLDRLWGNASRIIADLPVRSELGVRVITEPQPGQPDGLQADGSVVTSLAGGVLVEQWYRADVVAADASWRWSSTRLGGVTAERPALALGVTTSDSDAPLDIRFYRYSSSGGSPIVISADELGFGAVRPDRLFFAPYEGDVSPAWPSGLYVAQLLLGAGIVSIGFTLPAGPRPIPVVPERLRFTPTPESVRAALAAQLAGVFAIEGTGAATVAVAQAGRRLDPRESWLALAEPAGEDGPRVAQLPLRSAAILGVVLPRGSVLKDAAVWAAAPQVRSLAAMRISDTDAVSRPIVAFAPLAGAAWPAGMYGITARFVDEDDRLQDWSWHLDLGGWSGPRPFLMVAAAVWGEPARDWAVISTPIEPLLTRELAEPLEAAAEARLTISVPEALGETCPGSAHVDRVSPVIGLRIPGGFPVSSVRLLRRFDGGRSLVVPVQRVTIPSAGLVLFGQPRSAPRYWHDGIYDIEVTGTSGSAAADGPGRAPAYVPLCIGDLAAATSAFRMRPGSATVAAFEDALAAPGASVLEP